MHATLKQRLPGLGSRSVCALFGTETACRGVQGVRWSVGYASPITGDRLVLMELIDHRSVSDK
eukprot:376153-Rhodomonas_salina.1